MTLDGFSHVVNESFQTLERKLNGSSNGRLHATRRAALASFRAQGVPTTRHEEWKYTNVLPLLTSLQPTPENGAPAPLPAALDAMEAIRVSIADGKLVSAPIETDTVRVYVVDDATAAQHPDVSKLIGSIALGDAMPFVAVNTALQHSCVVIHVLGTVVEPILVDIVAEATESNVLGTPRILVVTQEHASATIIETIRTSQNCLVVPVCEINVATSAEISWIRVLDDVNLHQISALAANVHAHARVNVTTCSLNGAFIRNDAVLRLLHPEASGYLFGVSILDQRQIVDNHTVVDHVAPHCHSEELYKGVYSDASTGVFNGKIYVRKDAQKTTAYQSNRSLVLSEGAQVNAKPQLEIWADDVKCSHGATTGTIDEDALFYLRARGIPEDEARRMLTLAFAADVLDHIQVETLRLHLEQRLMERLKQ